jgi:hypothetical protein
LIFDLAQQGGIRHYLPEDAFEAQRVYLLEQSAGTDTQDIYMDEHTFGHRLQHLNMMLK